GWMVVVGDHLPDAVPEPDALGACGCGGQKHLRCRAMRVFLEKVMFHRPGIVDAEPVGEFDLQKGILYELALVVGTPGFGQLQFVEDPEFHGVRLPSSPSGPNGRPAADPSPENSGLKVASAGQISESGCEAIALTDHRGPDRC